MTVSTSTNTVVYRGNGAATQFAVPFKVLDEDHLRVRRRVFATGVVEYTYVGTDYSYTGIGASSGTLTLAGTALDDDYQLVIERIVPYTQDLDIVNAGGFYPETVEEQLDIMTMGIQQIADLAGRGAVVPVGETGLELPKASERAGTFFGFDADGDFTASSGTGSDGALRTDLADDDGGFLLLKYKRSEIGTFGRSALAADEAGMFGPGLSVMHFIDPDFDEAIRERTLTGENLSEAFNLAFAASLLAGNGIVSTGAGDFPIDVSDGDEGCIFVPEGANLHMDRRGWLLPAASSSAIIPLGDNELIVNIDGKALAPGNTPDQAWLLADAAIPNGVRAYDNEDYGLRAEKVRILRSRFKNLRYAIFGEGVKHWLVEGSEFERTFWSAILLMSSTDNSATHIGVRHNFFADIGDYCCALHEHASNTNGEHAFIEMAHNIAERANLRTNGHAFGAELGTVTLRRKISITHNLYDRGRADITFCRGLAVLNSCTDSQAVHNTAKGAGSTSSADEAITALNSKKILIASNNVSDYRGSAIALDDCDNADVNDNNVTNCGGSGNAFPIRLALNSGGRSISARRNRVSIDASYGAYAANVPSIGAVQAATKVLRDLSITDNILDRYFDVGVLVEGDATLKAINVEIARNKAFARESEDAATTWSESYAFQARHCAKASVSGNIAYDAKKGFDLRDIVGLVLDSNKLLGTGTLAIALRAGGSSIVRASGNRIHQTVTTRIVDASDVAMLPTALTDALFAWGDDFFPNVNAADDAAAATAGVNIGMEYHNAGARRVRVA